MDGPLKNPGFYTCYSKIDIRFLTVAPHGCSRINDILGQVTLLPGCIDYTLYSPIDGDFHWSIYGVWRSEEARACHYGSKDLQQLFNYLLQRNATLICCDQGAKTSVVGREGNVT
jgi:hypothetical protein